MTGWKWIVSPRDDLIYFIGSAALGFAFWGATIAGVPVPLLWWTWAVLFDAPHLFATATRTYLDAEMRSERPALLWGSLAWFPVGPLAVWAGAAPVFFAFAYVWAYVHLVKQHYGFMVLYKRRNGERDPLGDRIDAAFIHVALYAPYVAGILANRETARVLPAGAAAAAPIVIPAAVALTAAATVAYVADQAIRARRAAPNPPKWLLLAAACGLHWTVLATPSMPLLAVVMTLTIFHNVQYHRIIWHHNRRYAAPGAEARHGAWCARLARSLAAYAAVGVAFAVVYRFPRWYNLHIAPQEAWIEAAFWGFAFVHYWLDGRIWRVRRDPRLARGVLEPA